MNIVTLHSTTDYLDAPAGTTVVEGHGDQRVFYKTAMEYECPTPWEEKESKNKYSSFTLSGSQRVVTTV